MITEAENIILNKEYFELSADELATVSELVENAEEYDEMKWFLANTQGMIAQEKIEATPELKSKVMAHLNQSESKRKFWLNGVIPFFLPEDKKFYQKPAFQMGMAALVVVGVFMLMPNNINEDSVALNDRVGEFKEFGDGEKASGEQQTPFEEIEEDVDVVTIEAEDRDQSFTRVDNPVVVDEIELTEEITVDPMMDGYYEGNLSEDDLSKIENNNNQNTVNTGSDGGSIDGVSFDLADDDTDLKQDNGGDIGLSKNVDRANKTDMNNAPIVNGTTTSTGAYKDGAPGKNLATVSTISKKEKDKRKTNNERFKQDKKEFTDEDATLADYEAVPAEIPMAGGAFGMTDSISASDDKFAYQTLTEKANESSEILPYKMHVDETKELKKLFTVFK